MATPSDGIRIISGTTDILIIAPHGPIIDGEYQNDLRTSIIAEEIHRRLGCHTIINSRYFKPKGKITKNPENYFLDLFRIDHSRKVAGYLDAIETVVKSEGKTLVIWVHGIADDMAATQGQEHMDQGLFSGDPASLHALIGYGQGGDPKTGETADRFSARHETVDTFRKLLTSGGLTTLPTRKEGGNYRGRDAKRLNQWFNHLGYGFDQVESIQLEIREKDFRDTDENARYTGGIIANALADIRNW